MIEFDFTDLVTVEYDVVRTNECDAFGDDRKIRTRISSVDYNNVIKQYLDIQHNNDEILHYCIERSINCNGLYNADQWEINTRKYYYGEEIESIKFLGHKTVMENIKDLLNKKNNNERIEAVLNLEYGYLLEYIKNLDWTITYINKSDIVIGNKEHYNNLDQFYVEQYRDRTLPRCIIIPHKANKFKLIDGYHRLFASKEDKVKVILGK